jgi:hypothetical protein
VNRAVPKRRNGIGDAALAGSSTGSAGVGSTVASVRSDASYGK